jgi:predicted AAA+ superfamily ATPase
MIKRILNLSDSSSQTCFLWGPRQTGKSTLLQQLFPRAPRYDLLLSDEYRRLLSRPSLLREEYVRAAGDSHGASPLVIVDEVQKVPDLLDEIHWLIENKAARFILCGSSARKLKRGHANLLGGRAVRYQLFPFVYPELKEFSLSKALNAGLIPRHYLAEDPRKLIRSYIGDYLREEISAEAMTRNIASFGRFLEAAAITNGEMVNYVNIASDCGVSAPTVKAYFQILEDTLIGSFLPAYHKQVKRRLIYAPKFFFFDIGIVAELTNRGTVAQGSELFGRAFEHFLYLELVAHRQYSDLLYPLSYWRTASQFEIDFILGDCEAAVEVKGTDNVRDQHLKGLRAFAEEHRAKHRIVVSCEKRARQTTDGIEILPWQDFLDKLWQGKIIA